MYSTHGYHSDDEFMPNNVCLDVGKISKNSDLTKTPSNGQEYLQQVVMEASKCKRVVVANIDREKLRKQAFKPSNPFWNFIPEAPPVSDDLKASQAWQSHQIKCFLDLKKKICKMREDVLKGGVTNISLALLPKANKESKWKSLVLSEKLEPSLSVMLSFDQFLCEYIIFYINDWIEEGLTDIWEIGPFLYSIFVCMEPPLDSQAVFGLRSIARHCASIRAKMKDLDEKKLATLQLFICLVGNYFEQKDLLDIRNDSL